MRLNIVITACQGYFFYSTGYNNDCFSGKPLEISIEAISPNGKTGEIPFRFPIFAPFFLVKY
jgi:hypothetical protein